MSIQRALLVGSCVLIAGVGALSSPSAHAVPGSPLAQAGSPFQGTWWLSVGPPAPRPFILTMSGSGSFILEDSIDGGGHTFSGVSFSITQGSWTLAGARTVQGLGLRFVYDVVGKTRSVERVRLTATFGQGFDQLVGTYQIEGMGCTEQATPLPFTVPVCPDPTVAPSESLRGPAPFTAVKVPIQAPQD